MGGIFIFRRDLRIKDNLALNLLAKKVKHIIPIFLIDRAQIEKNEHNKYYYSPNAVQFIFESLADLNKQMGGKLLLIELPEFEKLLKSVSFVGFNLDFSPYAKKRDANIINLCKKHNVGVVTSDSDLTMHDIKIEAPLKQFGAYYRHMKRKRVVVKSVRVNFVKVNAKLYKPNYKINDLLDQRGGRKNALIALKRKKDRHISAYLNMGCISIREAKKIGKPLFWRDFFLKAMIKYKNNDLYSSYIDPRFNFLRKLPFSKAEFNKLWTCKTGFLAIDAYMTQMQKTGFCPNRGRLLLAAFWSKYLRIDMLHPKYGAQVGFSRLLVDSIGASQNLLNHHWMLDFDYPGRRFGKGISGRPFKLDIDDYDHVRKWLPHLSDMDNKTLKHWKGNSLHPGPMFDEKKRYLEWKKITSKH